MFENNEPESRIAMRVKYYNVHSDIQDAAIKAGLSYLPEFADSECSNRETVLYHHLQVIKKSQSRSLITAARRMLIRMLNNLKLEKPSKHGSNRIRIEPLRQVLSTLPYNAKATLLFEDTPYNDFNTLCDAINSSLHFLSNPGPRSKVSIYHAMGPRNFYNVLLPNPTADLGLAWSSFNYLSSQPQINVAPDASFAEFSKARAEALSVAGHADLIKLLRLRAQEIRPGGYLVAAIGGKKPAGEERETEAGAQPLQAAFISVMETGKLTRKEMAEFAMFPSHERTPEEIKQVLDLDEMKALWEIESFEPKLIAHPAWTVYENSLKSISCDEARLEVVEAYARATVTNLVSSTGWFWIDILKRTRSAE